MQRLNELLFYWCFGLAFLLPQLLARRRLVFLDDPVGDIIEDRVLLSGGDTNEKQRGHH